FRGRCEAGARIFLETPHHDAREMRRHIIGKGGRTIVEDRGDRFERVAAAKRTPSAERFVEDAAEREEIRLPADLTAADLLRRHVRNGPQDVSLLRGQYFSLLVFRRGFADSRQAEVENLHVAVDGEKNVFGFEIAMDDSPRMGRGKTGCYRNRDVDRFAPRKSSAIEAAPQRLAPQQLGDRVPDVMVLREIENRDDV